MYRYTKVNLFYMILYANTVSMYTGVLDEKIAVHTCKCINFVFFMYHYSAIFFLIIERKTPDSLSGDLVNGDHLSIPGMHDYSYGSLGAYNQMPPSPKSVTPQSPSAVPRSYTLGKVKGKVCIRAKWPSRPELILVSVA